MTMNLEEFKSKLSSISEHNGILYGRASKLFASEERHHNEILRYDGYLSLSDAFKCFFLESAELANMQLPLKTPNSLPEFYGLFVARLVHSFQSLCGAERLAMGGYPYHAYTLLRNTFDNLQLTSAAMQKITDFYSIEGLERGKPFDPKFTLTLRKKTEKKVRRWMSGESSGLPQETIDELRKFDEMFDLEVHGARLWLANKSGDWLGGMEALSILPEFNEHSFELFISGFCIVGWITHRLVPMFQLSIDAFGEKWIEKWCVLDCCFMEIVNAPTKEGKRKEIGAAIVEYVNAKHPLNENSIYC